MSAAKILTVLLTNTTGSTVALAPGDLRVRYQRRLVLADKRNAGPFGAGVSVLATAPRSIAATPRPVLARAPVLPEARSAGLELLKAFTAG